MPTRDERLGFVSRKGAKAQRRKGAKAQREFALHDFS
jgi:hypothetical protein